jgi:hypothetical protein
MKITNNLHQWREFFSPETITKLIGYGNLMAEYLQRINKLEEDNPSETVLIDITTKISDNDEFNNKMRDLEIQKIKNKVIELNDIKDQWNSYITALDGNQIKLISKSVKSVKEAIEDEKDIIELKPSSNIYDDVKYRSVRNKDISDLNKQLIEIGELRDAGEITEGGYDSLKQDIMEKIHNFKGTVDVDVMDFDGVQSTEPKQVTKPKTTLSDEQQKSKQSKQSELDNVKKEIELDNVKKEIEKLDKIIDRSSNLATKSLGSKYKIVLHIRKRKKLWRVRKKLEKELGYEITQNNNASASDKAKMIWGDVKGGAKKVKSGVERTGSVVGGGVKKVKGGAKRAGSVVGGGVKRVKGGVERAGSGVKSGFTRIIPSRSFGKTVKTKRKLKKRIGKRSKRKNGNRSIKKQKKKVPKRLRSRSRTYRKRSERTGRTVRAKSKKRKTRKSIRRNN